MKTDTKVQPILKPPNISKKKSMLFNIFSKPLSQKCDYINRYTHSGRSRQAFFHHFTAKAFALNEYLLFL